MQMHLFSPPAVALPESLALATTECPPRTQPIAAHRLVRETPIYGHYAASSPVRTAQDVFALMDPICAHESTESFYILCLNAQHRVVPDGIITITRGIVNSSLIAPREVFRAALAANAYAIILCHNHPSGDPTPSPEDRAVTSQLAAAGKAIDIDVIDHVIVGDGRFVSFAESGLLI